ncbi:MAG: SpoIIE family protein phosphatase [Ignavibacteria bacterium]|jgi:serine phosphatase RsbU (regulator of sigma subunit)
MKNFSDQIAKYRRRLLTPFTLALLLLGIINLYFQFNVTPQSNDECLWISKQVTEDSLEIVFDFVKFEGVTYKAGIRDGDRLLEINNHKTTTLNEASHALNLVPEGDSAQYKVSRNGFVFETKVEVKKLINYQGVSVIIFALIWVLVGYIVVMAKPDGFTQIMFYRIGALSTLTTCILLLTGTRGHNPLLDYSILIFVINFFSLFGVSFLPFVLVYFFWIFPRPNKLIKKDITKKLLLRIPFFTFIFTLIFVLVFVVYLKLIPYYSIAVLFNILLVLSLVVGFVSLIISYINLKTIHERNSVFVIVVAYTLSIVSLVYNITISNVFTGAIFNNPELFIPIIIIALLPVSFGYSIFKYSLMDVSEVFKNAVVYGIATVALAGIYFLVIYLLGQQISYAIGTDYQAIIAVVIFIIFAFVFQSTKDKFQELLTQKFYPEQFAYQKVILKFSNEISSIVGLNNILKSVEETFRESLRLERFGILLIDESGDKFKLRAGDGLFDNQLVISNENEFLRNVIDTKVKIKLMPVIEREEFESTFPANYKLLYEEEIYTVIPLRVKSNIIGLILFGLKFSKSKFAGKDLELLVAASNQIAVSIENARLYQAEAKNIEFESELRNARKIQESLLPRKIPQFKNLEVFGKMIPAMQVAGDYYDIIKITDEKFFVIIGDVSGKGLSASFYMTKLQTMIRLYCKEDISPKEVMIKINKEIFNEIERNSFITVAIALFDLNEKCVEYCRAGHTPLIRLEGNTVSKIVSKGIGVGLEKGEIFEPSIEQVKLPVENSIYVFYSDGVDETMNEQGDFFGHQRICDVILNNRSESAETIANNLIIAINEFRKVKIPHDDISLVVVKTK